LAALDGHGHLHLLDLDGAVRSVAVPREHGQLVVSPDGSWIATSHGPVIHLWKPDGSTIGVLHGHSEPVTCLSGSPDGRTLATSALDRSIRLWEISLASVDSPAPARTAVLSVATDGVDILSADATSIVRWRVGEQPEPVAPGRSATLSPDGRTYAYALGRGLEIGVIGDGPTCYVTARSGIRRLRLSCRTAVALYDDGVVQTWTLDGRYLAGFATGAAPDAGFAVSPDGSVVAIGGRPFRLFRTDGQLLVYLDFPFVRDAGFADDGTWLAAACSGRILIVGRDGTVLSSFPGNAHRVSCHAGAALVAAIDEDTVAVYDRHTGTRRAALRLGGAATDLCWLPDGSGVVVGGSAGVYVLDLHLDSDA
jgi:WD40 repeat protein